jgi:nitrite reductase/ring-hydroxylating ferredoxin subunit
MQTSDSTTWQEAATTADFEGSDRKEIDVGGEKIGLFKLEDGSYAAISVWCSHQQMSLMTGPVEDDEIMCPIHGAMFDLRTGEHLSPPAVRPIKTYQVKVEGDTIFVSP